MVGVLTRMKLTVMRRVLTGPRSGNIAGGAALGLAAAIGTIVLATLDTAEPSMLMDLLAVVFGIWALGWALGPAYGGQPVLRAEHFSLQPIPRRRLALSLLGTGFVGIAPVVTLIAFSALVVFAARLGVVPLLVALPGLALQMILVVLLARLAAHLLGALARSRVGGAISALIMALMLVAASSGWIVFVALDVLLDFGFSRNFSLSVRSLPSSWPLLAVEASARSDWRMTVLPLLGLATLVVLLVLLWARLLGPGGLSRPTVRGSAAGRPTLRIWPSTGPTAAVFAKELRSWLRDPVRIQSIVVAPAFALMTCLIPRFFDSTAFLPFLGALTALMAAIVSTNLYGQDGTALWLTLLMPGSERADVRGRQLAWLAVFGPMTVLLTVVGLLVGGHPDLWPWALAASAALLGGGAGLLPLIAVDQLVPGPDPRQHKDSPLDHGDLTGQAFVMMFLTAATALPALGVVLLGDKLDDELIQWLGIPVGLVTGVLAYVLLGRTAQQNLARRGPELLYLMRVGKEYQAQVGAEATALDVMPRSRQRLLKASVTVGAVALVPQAAVPTFMKLSGDIAPVWFLALYLPDEWQWPTIGFMFLLGVGGLVLAWKIYAAAQRELRRKRIGSAEVAPA